MNYKLIAIDMDGTLLNSKHEVSEENKEALKDAMNKGVKIVISTGRIFVSARYYGRLLGISTPIIACNGAFIKGNINDEEILLHTPINKDDCKKIIDILEENDINYRYYDDENFYIRKVDFITDKYREWNEKLELQDRIKFEVIKSPYEIINKNVDIYKFVVMEEDDNKLNKIKNIIKENSEVEIVSSWINSFDIMNMGVSKGKALEELCKKLNINRNEVIAIGDNENDLSMIKFAGVGVAMGNAEDVIKSQADVVTDSNDNHGVCKIIEKLIL